VHLAAACRCQIEPGEPALNLSMGHISQPYTSPPWPHMLAEDAGVPVPGRGCEVGVSRQPIVGPLAHRQAPPTSIYEGATREVEPSDDQATNEAVKEKFPRLDWHKLWADQAEQEWIHKPLLPARRLVAIYSAPKIGKSRLMLEMAVTQSRSEQFLGHTPDRRYRVLYVDYENDPLGDVRTRLQAMGYGPTTSITSTTYPSPPSRHG
jgi:AAA domain